MLTAFCLIATVFGFAEPTQKPTFTVSRSLKSASLVKTFTVARYSWSFSDRWDWPFS